MTDAKPLSGKTSIVTGSSSGIGRAIAEHLGEAGSHVFLSGRTASAMEASKKKIERLKQRNNEEGIPFLLWESQPNERIAKAITELGLRNVVFEPLESMDHLDYIAGMMTNFYRIETAISEMNDAK